MMGYCPVCGMFHEMSIRRLPPSIRAAWERAAKGTSVTYEKTLRTLRKRIDLARALEYLHVTSIGRRAMADLRAGDGRSQP